MTTAAQERSTGSLREGPRGRSWDILRLPVVGRFLRWRRSRIAMQAVGLLIALLMIGDAFLGPDLAPKNLATLLTWVHFRGLAVLALLMAGNLFCMACPFMLPRELARRAFSPSLRWPRFLRSKWPAVFCFVSVLFVYEQFDLWASPVWTGALIVAYFALATLVDSLFQHASFCKYVCPVGQLNFLASTLSPLEVRVREPHVCNGCQTKDCIRGAREPSTEGGRSRIVQRGCELGLFQPRKVGNLDCTFCLDCVYACPHGNVGLMPRVPGEELVHLGRRSGVGVVERRFDFTGLFVVFTFGALLNALAMVSPIYAAQRWCAEALGLQLEWPILAGTFAAALVVEPAILLLLAATATRWFTRAAESPVRLVKRFAGSLLPLGFGIWLAHYGFHFFTGCLTVIPVTQAAVQRALGVALLGLPGWHLGGLPESVVFPLELGFMGLGLLGSLSVTWTTARSLFPRRPLSGFIPFAFLHVLLFVSAVWIMTQPMEMRGTFLST